MSSTHSISSHLDQLEVFDNISLQLTYSKPVSSSSPDDGSPSNAFSPPDLRKSNKTSPSSQFTSLRSLESYDSTDIRSSYNSDFHSTADDSNALSKPSVAATLSTSSGDTLPDSTTCKTAFSSDAAENQGAVRRSFASVSVGGSDGYSSDFDSASSRDSTPAQISLRDMPAVEKNFYTDDFESMTLSYDESYSTDFDSHSSHSLPCNNYHDDFESSGNDFEYTQTHDSLTGEDERGVEIPSSMLLAERMREAVERNMDGSRESAENGVKTATEKLRQAIVQPANVVTFINKSMANLSESSHRTVKPEVIDGLGQMVRCGPAIGGRLPFAQRIQSLYIENITAGLKQKCDKLSEEIAQHEQHVRDHGGPHVIKEFALPRKMRLQREMFTYKLEQHQLEMNSVTMIGKIAESLPRPTEDPAILWQQLMHTAKRWTSDSL